MFRLPTNLHALQHGVRPRLVAHLEQLIMVDDGGELLGLPRRHRVRLGHEHDLGGLDCVVGSSSPPFNTANL